jgi:dTDP-4-dehydrorhamnose 3,5-epimerase-like enzyme
MFREIGIDVNFGQDNHFFFAQGTSKGLNFKILNPRNLVNNVR